MKVSLLSKIVEGSSIGSYWFPFFHGGLRLREIRLRWFDHIGRRSRDAPVRRMEKIDITQCKRLRRDKKIDMDGVVKNYMKLLELEERMVVDRNDWRRMIHVLDRV